MTRDQWLAKCAAQLRDKGGMDPGEAAALAIYLASNQQYAKGLDPSKWDDPATTADDEMSEWSDNESGE